MTRISTILCLLFVMVSCKQDPKDSNKTETTEAENNQTNEEPNKISTSEAIGFASGLENWTAVENIEFTFNVDKDGNHSERSWSWNPKTDDVTMISEGKKITYNRKAIDSSSINADKAFVNDKYWLLAPYQLTWDEGTTVSEAIKETAPISKEELNKVTLTYAGEGGYTPGDAYDFYYDDNFVVQEWIFRKGNAKEPSMITTFENYKTFNGIQIAQEHKTADGNFNLYFTDIKVE